MSLSRGWYFINHGNGESIDMIDSDSTSNESHGHVEWSKQYLWKGDEPIDLFLEVGEWRGNVKSGTLYLSTAFIHYVPSIKNPTVSRIALWSIDKISLHTSIAALPTAFPFKESAADDYKDKVFVEVKCKTFEVYQFAFDSSQKAVRFKEDVTKHCYADSQLQSFSYRNKKFPNTLNSWSIFSWGDEYNRLCINSKHWRITEANSSYELCRSYPAKFIVPTNISDEELKAISKFRSSGRIPALSWVHRNGASITRCSQPLVGVLMNRCTEDEKYIDEIWRMNCSSESQKLLIVDCRSPTSAYLNSLKNGGTESVAYYKNCSQLFCGIANIHVMRDSMKQLDRYATFHLVGSEATWMAHVKLVLESAITIVNTLNKEISVLIHCSDGWDRTAQCSAIAQLFLDPHYRTIIGFEQLIEKEWVSFGHKFFDRIGHGQRGFWTQHECSPIFLQFLDCVYQILVQNPNLFEFNAEFLSVIMDSVYGCSFGNFLFNNERERKENELFTKTPDLWDFINTSAKKLNIINEKFISDTYCQTKINVNIDKLRVWDYHIRSFGAKKLSNPLEEKEKRCSNFPSEKSVFETFTGTFADMLNSTFKVKDDAKIVVSADDSRLRVAIERNSPGLTNHIIEDYNPNSENEQFQDLLNSPFVELPENGIDPQWDIPTWAEYLGGLAGSILQLVNYPQKAEKTTS